MIRTISRLEQTHRRLQGQLLAFDYAFGVIEKMPGIVAELGLGHGRTFDHLRRRLPGREIYAFDHRDDAYEDCRPDPACFIAGEITQTFPAFAQRHAGRIVLINTDIGSFDLERDARLAAVMSRLLPPAIAPGGIIMSDLALDAAGCERVELPPSEWPGQYYLYRKPA
jgi:hypothetical protein